MYTCIVRVCQQNTFSSFADSHPEDCASHVYKSMVLSILSGLCADSGLVCSTIALYKLCNQEDAFSCNIPFCKRFYHAVFVHYHILFCSFKFVNISANYTNRSVIISLLNVFQVKSTPLHRVLKPLNDIILTKQR